MSSGRTPVSAAHGEMIRQGRVGLGATCTPARKHITFSLGAASAGPFRYRDSPALFRSGSTRGFGAPSLSGREKGQPAVGGRCAGWNRGFRRAGPRPRRRLCRPTQSAEPPRQRASERPCPSSCPRRERGLACLRAASSGTTQFSLND